MVQGARIDPRSGNGHRDQETVGTGFFGESSTIAVCREAMRSSNKFSSPKRTMQFGLSAALSAVDALPPEA
jgi:hypothetical protein